MPAGEALISVNETNKLIIGNGDHDDVEDDILNTADPDNGPEELTYTITDAPDDGTLWVGDVAIGINGTFTQEDINANQLYYIFDPEKEQADDDPTTDDDSFSFKVSDGTTSTEGIQVFNINVNPVNDPPIVDPDVLTDGKLTAEVQEDSILEIKNTVLNVTDNDKGDGVTYKLETATENGTLWFDKNGDGILNKGEESALVKGSIFTQADIDAGTLTYKYDESKEPVAGIDDSFVFTATDGHGGNLVATTFTIDVEGSIDNPRLETPDSAVSVWEGEGSYAKDPLYARNVAVIDNSRLYVSDGDSASDKITFTVKDNPDYGTLFLDNDNNKVLSSGDTTLSSGLTFSQKDIDDGKLLYQHNGGDNVDNKDTFSFTVKDDVGAQDDISEQTFTINVYGVNDAPSLDIPTPYYEDVQGINKDNIVADNENTTADEFYNGNTKGFINIDLSIKDPDADKGNITVILKTDPAEGLIAVDKTILNVDVEDNGQPGFLIIEGKLEDVNKSLDTLRFWGIKTGETEIVIEVLDNGNTGVNSVTGLDSDNVENDSGIIKIHVTSLYEPEVAPNAADANVTIFEDTTHQFNSDQSTGSLLRFNGKC